jgi:hypothetical protein
MIPGLPVLCRDQEEKMARKIIRRLKLWIPITVAIAIHISMVVWATEKGLSVKAVEWIIP